jgi:hypothetical protein
MHFIDPTLSDIGTSSMVKVNVESANIYCELSDYTSCRTAAACIFYCMNILSISVSLKMLKNSHSKPMLPSRGRKEPKLSAGAES